jgi:hypothetical protein
VADINFLDLAPELQMKAPDAPLPYISRVLRESAVEFCEESESYVYRLDPVVVIEGESEYELDTPRHTRVVKAWRLYFSGRPMEPSSEVLLDAELPGWDTTKTEPSRYFFRSNVLTLAPVPPATLTGAVTGAVSLKPTRTAQGIDEDFFDENSQAIFDGALAKMFRDSSQPWGDLTLSQMHHALFQQGIEDAKSKAQQDHTAKRRDMSYGGI